MIYCTRCYWRPRCRPWQMTSVTSISTADMVRRFSTCLNTVVTTGTASQYLVVVHSIGCHWSPRYRRCLMACFTSVRGSYMSRRFTACLYTIVTTETGSYDLRVVDSISSNWYPRCWTRQVAGITGIGGINM